MGSCLDLASATRLSIWQPLPAACLQEAHCLFWQEQRVVINGVLVPEGGSAGAGARHQEAAAAFQVL